MVYYVTDNVSVRSWLEKRKPKNPLARHLLRVLQTLEALHNIHVTCFYIRTYHNEVADWLTKEELPKVHEELAVEEWTRLDPRGEWAQLLEDAQTRLLRIPREAGRGADAALRQLALRRPAPMPIGVSSGAYGRELSACQLSPGLL